MELRHLRYFVAVAEERSFLRAAERLHISQPPLSTQIKDLELELGAKLFERSSRGTELTAVGRVLYSEGLAILAHIERARIAATRAAQGKEGNLSIGFISIADYSVLPPTLRQFRAQYPAVDVQLHELTTDVQIRELLAERLDIGIALGPVKESFLAFYPLFSEQLMIAVPVDHRLAIRGSPVRLKELSREQFVMPPRVLAPGLYDIVMSFCRRSGFVPQVAQYAKQMQTVVSLVSSGFGVAFVPRSLQGLHRSGVVYLPLREKGPSIEVGLAYRKRDRNSVIRNFLECAKRIYE